MTQDRGRSPSVIVRELGAQAYGDDLARLVHSLAWSAYDERRTSLEEGLDEAATRLAIDETKAETTFGNVLRALKKGTTATGPERTLLGALVAKGVALAPPAGKEAELRVAEALLWIASHTVADALPALDAAMGAGAGPIWSAVAALTQKHDDGAAGAIERPAALLAVAALRDGASPAAKEEGAALRVALRDPTLLTLLGAGEAVVTSGAISAAEVAFEAEETAPPRGPIATVLLTVSFILPVLSAWRIFARYALRLRRTATITVDQEGVRAKLRTEMLGRQMKEREIFIPRDGLTRAAREVRFPRLATYVGIGALLVGSYLGVRILIDGARSGSPELLGLGIAVLVGALAVDYLLSLLPLRPDTRCRVVFEPRRGRALALAGVDRVAADAALARLARAPS